MVSRFTKIRVAVVALGMGLLAAAPAFAGSVVVGSVLGATEATMGREPVIPGATVFSGDDLRIGNGVAVVTVGQGSRIVFGRDSLARFERESDSVTTILADGSISMFHPVGDKTDLHFRIGNVTITPARGYETLGEVVMNSNALVISTSQGLLTVQANGTTISVTKGHAMNFIPKASRAPQTGVAQKVETDWPQTLLWAGAGAAGVAAVLAGISISRSTDARDAANAATLAANSAASAAAAAASAAAAALSEANVALSNAILASQSLCSVLAGLEGKNPSVSVPPGTCSDTSSTSAFRH